MFFRHSLLRNVPVWGVLCSLFLAITLPAQEATPAPEEPQLNIITGPATVQLGDVATLNLPEGYQFIGPDSLEMFFAMTQNQMGGNEVGVVIAQEWTLFFDYNPIGYVKDDDKADLDADKLYAAMAEGQESSNTARQERGWDTMQLRGWSTPPHYDEKTNNLKWAYKLASSSDNFASTWINENVRLLGRGGVIEATLVTNLERFPQSEAEMDQFLAGSFGFVAGETYAEYKKGDKIAKYGLAALVLGGAGAVALKTGLLAKLWKPIAIAGAALVSFLAKMWNKITGKQPSA